MKNLHKILQFIHTLEKLKTVQRAVSVSDNSRKESPAEHTWRVAMIAILLHKELKLELDLLHTLKIILVHDIVEIEADDIWIKEKTPQALQEKFNRELQAAEKIYTQLPDTHKNELKTLWIEYVTGVTAEARFAIALDKIEVIIQRINLGKKHWEKESIYEIMLHWADNAVENFPELQEFWSLVQKDLTKHVQENT